MTTLQTLDRGLTVLELVAAEADGLPVSALADQLGVHRAVAYRIVATLAAHGLVSRGATDGRVRLGAGAAVLGSAYAPTLRRVARSPRVQQP